MQIERYTAQMAGDVAALIEECFAPYRRHRPLTLLSPPAPWATGEELLDTLTSGALCAEAGHVALDDGRPVSAALAVRGGDGCGWWRIATAPGYRRRGLAASCIEAGESALRDAGRPSIRTDAVVDSRWPGAGELFASLGYELEDPERRNITMLAEHWEPRPVEPAEGYALGGLREEDLPEWMEVRNAVFGGDAGPEWFEQRFLNRPEFEPSSWFVARHDGRIVGIAGALLTEHDRDPRMLRGGQIEWVGVLDDHRGRRLGEDLMIACLNTIAERGFLPAILITQPFRVPAVCLYEKLGFRTVAAWHSWSRALG